jgi:transcriptional regulator NrdR family protein
MMNKSVSYCPECLSKSYRRKLKVIDTREYFKLGYPSFKRRKKCLTCGYRVNTVEIYLEKGKTK